jgi:hypothetical protein
MTVASAFASHCPPRQNSSEILRNQRQLSRCFAHRRGDCLCR